MKEEETYDYIKFLIEETFKNEDLKKEVFYGTIPDSIISSFNKRLDIDFRENIEYLLFYNDSLDDSGNEGIAIVKNEENYFLIFKEYRHAPVIFFLYSIYEIWKIARFTLDEFNYNFNVFIDRDEIVINDNERHYYVLDEMKGTEQAKIKVYAFHFYNKKFLKLLIGLCERIDDEL